MMQNLLSSAELADALMTKPSVFLFPEDRGGTTLLHSIPGRSSEYISVNRAGIVLFSSRLPSGCGEVRSVDNTIARALPALIARGERMAREGRAPLNEAIFDL